MIYNYAIQVLLEGIMAYCDKCGAYIPDGQSKCLACGYDPTEEQKRSAYAYQQQEDQRAQAEQRRRERQEADRKWAENEQRRRSMDEEFKRHQKEAEENARSFVNRARESAGSWQETENGRFRVTTENNRPRTSAGQNKLLAALSYVSILFLIPLLFTQNDEFAKFHARQGARLFVCNAIGTVLGSIFPVGWIINLLLIYLMVVGIKNALNEKWEPLPYIGKFKLF